VTGAPLPNWTPGPRATPLTLADLNKAIANLLADERDEILQRAEAVAKFTQTVPPWKMGDPRIVLVMQMMHGGVWSPTAASAAAAGAQDAIDEARAEMFVDPGVKEPTYVWFYSRIVEQFIKIALSAHQPMPAQVVDVVGLAGGQSPERVIVDDAGVGLAFYDTLVDHVMRMPYGPPPWTVHRLSRL
jgi:hypothetical protein